jgi:6-pyruvoyltetrahydropterin/6-carboxytetrahydropterin synthase
MGNTITVSHNAETAHRIPGLPGAGAKCGNVHGHSFWIQWTFDINGTDAHHGAEFSRIKSALRGWVDEYLDHGFVVRDGDPVGLFLEEMGLKVLFLSEHPTTEILAQVLADKAAELLPDLVCTRVHVKETNVNAATWELD